MRPQWQQSVFGEMNNYLKHLVSPHGLLMNVKVEVRHI